MDVTSRDYQLVDWARPTATGPSIDNSSLLGRGAMDKKIHSVSTDDAKARTEARRLFDLWFERDRARGGKNPQQN